MSNIRMNETFCRLDQWPARRLSALYSHNIRQVRSMVKLSEENLYDVRLVERHIRQGLITRADYDAYLKKVQDSTEQRDVIDMDVLANGHSHDDNAAA